jgi:hypothetical protein
MITMKLQGTKSMPQKIICDEDVFLLPVKYGKKNQAEPRTQ